MQGCTKLDATIREAFQLENLNNVCAWEGADRESSYVAILTEGRVISVPGASVSKLAKRFGAIVDVRDIDVYQRFGPEASAEMIDLLEDAMLGGGCKSVEALYGRIEATVVAYLKYGKPAIRPALRPKGLHGAICAIYATNLGYFDTKGEWQIHTLGHAIAVYKLKLKMVPMWLMQATPEEYRLTMDRIAYLTDTKDCKSLEYSVERTLRGVQRPGERCVFDKLKRGANYQDYVGEVRKQFGAEVGHFCEWINPQGLLSRALTGVMEFSHWNSNEGLSAKERASRFDKISVTVYLTEALNPYLMDKVLKTNRAAISKLVANYLAKNVTFKKFGVPLSTLKVNNVERTKHELIYNIQLKDELIQLES